MQISPLLTQVLVAISPQLAAFSVGGAVTFPSVLIDHYRNDNSTIQLDLNMRSWIGSMYGMSGIPVILMPVLTQLIGRKFGYIMSCTYVLIGWILTYNANSVTEILVSEVFHGLAVNSLLPISFLGMSEMLAPKYRFISMQAFGIAQCLGMATTGIVGKLFHFKIVCIVMFVPIVVALCIACIWPESPSWFACRGEFEKCSKAFIKLRGTDELAIRELNELITAQKENLTKKDSKIGCRTFCEKISNRDFYMPLLHTFVLINMMYWSGADVVIIYFMEMASKSTTDANATFYAAIVMYVIIVLGMITADILIIKFNNKTVLLSSMFGVIIFLSAASIITGLQKLGVLSSDSLLCVYCLLLCIASACCGLDSLVFIISVELMPVRHRSFGGALYIVINCILYASSQKLSPYLFQSIDLWGSFLLYAINGVVCALIVWKYVPETKGRSLQEIEDFYVNGEFVKRRVDVNDEFQPIVSA